MQQSLRLCDHKAALILIFLQSEVSADYLTDVLILTACKCSAEYVFEMMHNSVFRLIFFISLMLSDEAQPVRYLFLTDHVPQMINTQMINTSVTHTQMTDHSESISDSKRQLNHSEMQWQHVQTM